MPDVAMEITGQNQPVVMSEPASAQIDFGALREQASKMMDTPEDEVATPDPTPTTTNEPDPTKVRAKVAEVAPVAADKVNVAAPEVVVTQKLPADLSDDTLVKVTVDGEEQILPWAEAKGKISGGLKFTKSMQQLAKEKADWQAEQADLSRLRTERANLEKFLNNEEAVTGFVKGKFPHLFAAKQAAEAAVAAESGFNPDEIATVGQARTLAEQQLAGVTAQISDIQRSVQTQIADALQVANREAAAAAEQAGHATVIQSTLADIFTKNPVLNSIPNAESLIRFEVQKLQPQTREAALEGFRMVAAGMVEEIGKHFKANQKIEAVAAAKAKLTSTPIEPAGGATPSIAPTSFKDASGQVDWKKVQQAARDFA